VCATTSSTSSRTSCGGRLRVDHLDLGTVAHDLFHRPLAEVERAEDAVAVFLFDDAFGMADRKGAHDLLAHGEDVAVGDRRGPRRGAAFPARAARTAVTMGAKTRTRTRMIGATREATTSGFVMA
jgi:hypothetical protein